jgi:2-keto-4-pentenoate hydratase
MELASGLYIAERAAKPDESLSGRHPDLDPAAAYAIQERYAQLRIEAGARLIGRKIGCTNKTIQEFFNIDTPDFGQLFDDMVVADAAEIAVMNLIAPMVEPELTFLLEKDLRGPGLTVVDVLDATASVLPSLEIIDSRIRGWDITFVDTVADNGSSARCVFGAALPYDPVSTVDLRGERVRLLRDGAELDTGLGEVVLGHPAAAVAWLANALAEYDRGLRAGDYVMSGSTTGAVPALAGETYTAVFDSYGTVSCRFV